MDLRGKDIQRCKGCQKWFFYEYEVTRGPFCKECEIAIKHIFLEESIGVPF
jgi:hypothetical protein